MSRIPVTREGSTYNGVSSQAIIAGGLIFCSGVLPYDHRTGVLIDGDIEARTAQCIQNLAGVLESGGSSLQQVAKVNIYLVEETDFPRVNKVYKQFFTGREQPARTCVFVKSLPLGGNIEMECVGVVQKSK